MAMDVAADGGQLGLKASQEIGRRAAHDVCEPLL
jgi:hypothetical protein